MTTWVVQGPLKLLEVLRCPVELLLDLEENHLRWLIEWWWKAQVARNFITGSLVFIQKWRVLIKDNVAGLTEAKTTCEPMSTPRTFDYKSA